jgi:hypothetical protein
MLIEAPVLVVKTKESAPTGWALVNSDAIDFLETAALWYGLSGAGRNNELAGCESVL